METETDIRLAVKNIGEALAFTPNENNELFLMQLTTIINDMITRDFPGVLALLYRLDINEKNLKGLLDQQQAVLSGRVIAELIYKRQLKKIQSRREYRKESDIDGSEKW